MYVSYFLQVLDEVCICGVVFNDRNSAETTITHLLVNWPSSMEEFYTRRTSCSDLAAKPVFSGKQGGSRVVMGVAEQGAESKVQTAMQSSHRNDSPLPSPLLSPDCESGSPESPAPRDDEGHVSQFGALWNAPPPFNVSWGSVSCHSHIGPAHNGHGTYVYRLSPSGDVSALAVNERKARNIRVFFFSPLTPGELSNTVYPLAREESKQTGR